MIRGDHYSDVSRNRFGCEGKGSIRYGIKYDAVDTIINDIIHDMNIMYEHTGKES